MGSVEVGCKAKVVPTTCDHFLLPSCGHVMQQHVPRPPHPSTDGFHEGAFAGWRRLPSGGEQSDV